MHSRRLLFHGGYSSLFSLSESRGIAELPEQGVARAGELCFNLGRLAAPSPRVECRRVATPRSEYAGVDETVTQGDTAVLYSVQSVSKVYRMGEVDVWALREASLDVLDGELLIIVGPSGSGKSTLLNLIGGMDSPTSGKLLYRGKDLSQASDAELTRFRRDEVGFVFQFYNLVPTLTALENVQVSVELSADPMEASEALRLVNLADKADNFPAQLSGGQQQRVAIARALAGNPRLLLCDEPTGALDLESSRQVLGLLAHLRRDFKKTVILITHNGAIAGIGQRVAIIRDGTIDSIRVNEKPVPVEEVRW
jgi:putative ABC transport system ATP-binding protein